MSTILDLAEWACALSLDHAPPGVLERLRWQAASVFGAAAAGLDSDDVGPVLAMARGLGSGDLVVAPGLADLSLEGALLAGSTLSMAHDYDDWMLCGHTGHSAVWASWLGAAEAGLTWDDALRAQLAANEVMARLGGLCIAGRQNGQAWSFIHSVGGALAYGMLRGLDAERLAHGIALALAQAPHVDWGLFGSGGKVLTAARPLLDGWRMAKLAEAGMNGPLGLLDGESDFLAVHAQGRPLRGWLTGLPAHDPTKTAWLTWSLAIKAVPGCAYLATSLEALDLIAEDFEAEEGRALRAADVMRIDVDAGLLTMAMERLLGADAPLTPVSINFSVARSLALRLIAGSIRSSDLSERSLEQHGHDIAELATRIWLHHDWRLTLKTWNALKVGVGIDKLLAGVGAVPLLAAASRAGGGLEAGLSLAELPMALAGERFQELDGEEPTELLNRGIGKLSDLAARGLQRLLGPTFETPARRRGPDLSEHDLAALTFPIPARIRVLLHGGRVREAEVAVARGAPSRPESETRRVVHDKLRAALDHRAPGRAAAHERLATALVGALGGDNRKPGLAPLPGSGPAELLRRLDG